MKELYYGYGGRRRYYIDIDRWSAPDDYRNGRGDAMQQFVVVVRRVGRHRRIGSDVVGDKIALNIQRQRVACTNLF